jgi:hypothetical protein
MGDRASRQTVAPAEQIDFATVAAERKSKGAPKRPPPTLSNESARALRLSHPLLQLVDEGIRYELRVGKWMRFFCNWSPEEVDLDECVMTALQDSLMLLAVRKQTGRSDLTPPVNADGSVSELLVAEFLERIPHDPLSAHKVIARLQQDIGRFLKAGGILRGPWGTIGIRHGKLSWVVTLRPPILPRPSFEGWHPTQAITEE